MAIQATLKRIWNLLDAGTLEAGKPKTAPTGPGSFPLERIPNPLGYEGNWLVLAGTRIGMAEGAWKQWRNGTLATEGPNAGQPIDWEAFEIILEET